MARYTDTALDLYITVNSPGEINGWAAPLIRELKVRVRNSRVTAVIVPCQYASGEEQGLAASAGADRVIKLGSLGDTLRKDREDGSSRAFPKKLTIHLGGDMFFSVFVSRRVGSPLWAYASRPRWARWVDRFMIPDKRAERLFAVLGFTKDKYKRIGHLALDSVVVDETEDETRKALGISPDDEIVSFVTGSRPIEYLRGVPYFTHVASMIADKRPETRMIFPLAPTVDEDRLCSAVATNGIKWRGERRIREIMIGHDVRSGEERYAKVVRGRTLEVLNCSTLAVAVPGTSNLQAAALYTPLLMVLPLDDAEHFPVDGIMGSLPLSIPGIRSLKKRYIMKLNAKVEYVSLPNRLAGKMIAPELRGIFDKRHVADKAIALLSDKEALKEISRGFWELTRERGAAGIFADDIDEWRRRGK